MGPIGHTAASLGLGGVAWAATGSPLALPVAVTKGAFVDLDHVIAFLTLPDKWLTIDNVVPKLRTLPTTKPTV